MGPKIEGKEYWSSLFSSPLSSQSDKMEVVSLDPFDLGLRDYLRLHMNKYDVMWCQRAYVHWIVACGMSEDSLSEGRENIEVIIKDYEWLESGQDLNIDDEVSSAFNCIILVK